MKVIEVKDLLEAEILVGDGMLETEIKSACGSDLLSDVLSFVKSHTVLLTGLTNPHVIKISDVLEISAIVFVRGKCPSKELIDMAVQKGIAVLTTRHTLYEACGILYGAGLPGVTKA